MMVRRGVSRGNGSVAVTLVMVLHACGGAGTSVVGADVPSTSTTMQGPPAGDASTMGSARACTDSSQCGGACPSGTSMCTCASTPMGMTCVPGCSTTDDCPRGGAQSLVCETRMHLCVPPGDGGVGGGDGGAAPDAMMPPGDGGAPPPDGMMMPPGDGGAPPGDGGAMTARACTSSAECAGACPGTPSGCGCGATPMGMRCIPTCTTSAQCPMGMNGTTLMCRDGFCAP